MQHYWPWQMQDKLNRQSANLSFLLLPSPSISKQKICQICQQLYSAQQSFLAGWTINCLTQLEQWHNCSVRTPIQFPHDCRYRKGLPGTCSSQRDTEPSLPFQATSPFYSQNQDFVRTFWVNIFSLASSCTAGFQGEKLWRKYSSLLPHSFGN